MDELNEYVPRVALLRMIRSDVDALKRLFLCATSLPLLLVGWVCLLRVIRWVNQEPENRQVRLLWVGLWCCGFGYVLFGVVSFALFAR